MGSLPRLIITSVSDKKWIVKGHGNEKMGVMRASIRSICETPAFSATMPTYVKYFRRYYGAAESYSLPGRTGNTSLARETYSVGPACHILSSGG